MYRDRGVYMGLLIGIGLLINLLLDFLPRFFGLWLSTFYILHPYTKWTIAMVVTTSISYPLWMGYISAVYGFRNISAMIGIVSAIFWALRNDITLSHNFHMSKPVFDGLIVLAGGSLLTFCISSYFRSFRGIPRRQ